MKKMVFEGYKGHVTYPRSGTHWVQQIIQLILSKGVSVKTFNEFLEKAPFLEVQEVKTTASPRLLRTHFSMSKLRLSEKAKYIYVARNPWDCCVSCYYLIRESPATEFTNGTCDDFLDAFLEAKIGFGDYFEHVLSGYNHRGDSNVFFVTYEELQTNKKDVVLRLAEFLGKHHRKVLEENQEVLQQVMEKTTVAFMKNFMTTKPKEVLKVLKKNSPHLQPAQVISNQESCQSTDIHILRKGVVGDWKQHFTPENIVKMQTAIMERTKGSDIMDLWKCD
ncbi:amine sulfotransferase-like isoform X2 [Ixodes scapularis]|uniref:amine sulfotransferase-like isoform X2 n=1 Tax=Ixodes scapularis TaxID=6945 RepID=UPI001A9DEB42|nr:amine sulfotransferase-like isoform X2 [Ixodes scapularis]